ncbi:MAG: hypothetical protein IJ064_03290 [Bacteroidaceae bacterium]|nr:hypothetical protein [Bacteroidaceae bacterium]
MSSRICHIIPALLLLFCTTGVQAQFENATDEELLGGKEKYSENLKYYNSFNKFRDRFSTDRIGKFDKEPADTWPCDSMYECWRRIYTAAPFVHENIYIQGATMLDSMALHATQKSEAERLLYFQDLMQVYDDRIRRLDSLNSMVKEEKYKRSRPAVMVKAASVFRDTAPKVKGSGYTPLIAYEKFTKAFAAIREAANAGNDEMSAGYLVEYILACRDLFETDKERYFEQFLTDYTACLESSSKMMAAYANGVDPDNWKRYAGAYNDIQYYFIQAGANNVESLEAYYKPRLDSIKGDYNALANALKLMLGCQDMLKSFVFYKACHLAYNLQPDYLNCIGLALEAKEEFQDKDEALKYFKEADEYASAPKERYLTSSLIGTAMMDEQEPQKTLEYASYTPQQKNEAIYAWRGRQKIAANKLQEAIDYAKQAGMPAQDWASLYLSMALAYSRTREESAMTLAYDALEEAPIAYPAINMQNVNNSRINVDKNNDAMKKEVEARNKNLANAKNRQAQMDAYNAYKAKQKAEEDFWAGKK